MPTLNVVERASSQSPASPLSDDLRTQTNRVYDVQALLRIALQLFNELDVPDKPANELSRLLSVAEETCDDICDKLDLTISSLEKTEQRGGAHG
jgi:hypothetical protein